MEINLKAFRKKASKNKSTFKRYLKGIEKKPPRGLNALAIHADLEAWKETDCLACANCCKTMSPTYTSTDIKRIALHLQMTPDAFSKKWLRKDKEGDWINKTEPCQFLNLENNYCAIYEVRPKDCAGFPHHTKRHTSQYTHVFAQNIEYCPATYRMVERMMTASRTNGNWLFASSTPIPPLLPVPQVYTSSIKKKSGG